MKKVLFTALMGIFALTAGAQSNIQFHYDFGKHFSNEREHNRMDVTLTYEGFHADKLGSWYYFIDADFSKNGMTSAYTEISREFNVKKLNESMTLAAHAEVNAGLSNSRWVGSYQPAFLVGPALNWHNKNFSKTFSIQLMYKQFWGQAYDISGDSHEGETKGAYPSFQLTGVWGINFCNDKLRFAGFIDFWRGLDYDTNHGNLVILTEPQLWYNISKSCAFGTEWEISNNFINSSEDASNNHFFVNPTLAFKYQF